MDLRPDSLLPRFMLDTKYVRIVGRYIFSSFATTLDDGTRLSLRSRGSDRGVAREIFEERIYETMFAPNPGDVVVDAGANIGCFSLQAAKKVGVTGKVIAFEPIDENYRMLVRNIRLNNATNIAAERLGLGDSAGEAEIGVYGRGGDSSIMFPRYAKPPRTTKKIGITTLDRQRLQKLDFLKLDTEGFELNILRGAKGMLEKHHPKIVGEAHPSVSDSAEVIMDYLRGFDYDGSIENDPKKNLQMFYAWPKRVGEV
jgi:FkbM family methyltransferase